MNRLSFPRKFLAAGWHSGIKSDSSKPDFGVLYSTSPCSGAAIFTRNNFPASPVMIGRQHASDGDIRAVIVNSGCANAATGETGLTTARKSCLTAAASLGILPKQIIPASTGMIGSILPDTIIQQACLEIPERLKHFEISSFAEAICTTDKFPKIMHSEIDQIRIYGVAKGAGMIEPNMATMLSFLCTDASIAVSDLQRLLKVIANFSFNRISVDSDTSTNDTVVLLANGASGKKVSLSQKDSEALAKLSYPFRDDELNKIQGLDSSSRSFIKALLDICVSLAHMIVKDGEGSRKVIQLQVEEASHKEQAHKIGRSILNSPLFKTAMYGNDPNWGRIFMAVGKVMDEPIEEKKLQIYFGDYLLKQGEDTTWISNYLKKDFISIRVLLGNGHSQETMWGCDLTEDYVRFNSIYTT